MATSSSHDLRAERAARNQALFREINERVRSLNQAFDGLLPLGDWVCECADRECVERLHFSVAEYEALRSDPTHFAVAPEEGHVVDDVEVVVEKRDAYWIVEKVGEAARIAETFDTRS
jgi:hypothetical protein